MMEQFLWWNLIYFNNCYSIMQSRNVKINKFLSFPKLSLEKHTHRLCQKTQFPQSEIFDTIGKLSDLSGSPNLIQKWWTFRSWQTNGRPFCSVKHKTCICWAKLLKLCPHLDLIISYRKNFFLFKTNIVPNRWKTHQQKLVNGENQHWLFFGDAFFTCLWQ